MLRSRQWRRLLLQIIAVSLFALVLLIALLVISPFDTRPVPDLVGQTASEAAQSVGNDFTLTVSDRKASEEPRDTVLSHKPEPDERAQKGSRIAVVLSAGNVIFQDDFSSTSSGWDRLNDKTFLADYADGGYAIDVPPPPATVSVPIKNPGTIEDVVVEVDASRAGGAPKKVSGWGVSCRYVDAKNYYKLGISSNGYPYIFKIKEGNHITIAPEESDPNPSPAILQGTKTNHIRAYCVGSKLSLYVNSAELLEVDDAEFKSGLVGLYVDNNAEESPGTRVQFDNFLVTKP